ncbi:MAG: helix-turn-helix transcriptional regulator [Spirochaetes bacterium]|nr:helix-turn-helix transcriptional regulator [Spirochaetota bacterium]
MANPGTTDIASQFLTLLYLNKYTYSHSYSAGPNPSTGFPNSCIGFIIQGSADFIAKTETLHARQGDIIYIPKGQKYVSRWRGTPEIEFYSLNFEFRSNVLPGDLFKFQIIKDSAHSAKRALDRIYDTLNKNDFYAGIGDFYKLYHTLSRKLAYSGIRPGITQVQEAVQYIESHYLTDFSNSQLAARCNLSESRFYTLFKDSTGCTPIEYKNKVRIKHAMGFLVTGTNTVEWISEYLNFSSPAYFRKVLKMVAGKTPKEIRRQIKSI